MDYTIKIVDIDQVPNDFYIDTPNLIHFIEFTNGLKYYNSLSFNTVKSYYCVEELNLYYDIPNNITNAEKLHEYYNNELNIHIKYSNCEKMWNYYNNNKILIQEVRDYYNNIKNDD